MRTKITLFLIFILITAQTYNNLNFQNPIKTFTIDKALDEISGITISGSGEIFCHNDESGIIFQLDKNNYTIQKKIRIGENLITDDFEDIALSDNYFYLTNSSGDIYKVEKKNPQKYYLIETGLSKKNDVEGLCYNPERNSLFLVCKGNPGIKEKGVKAVYEFNLTSSTLGSKPIFLLNVDEITVKTARKSFTPSAIYYNPTKKTYLILDSKSFTMVESDITGKILQIYLLKKEFHKQPEGLTIDKSGKILIADEAAGSNATITVYSQK